ncbi:TetR/AcrR family transcriptional regulator [Salinicoccus sesuvii]|uniref:TetR/AcrR family transcriptional regulator n=1 Tax=Salinicoccus sesuvii TaxID=868281 RepID=A0ABV7N7B0_9STAP
MVDQKLNTSDKLMVIAIDLFSDRGYKSVTTAEIASNAGVSEKTLFRHFGSKQNLLEKAFERFHYTDDISLIFEEKIVWELKSDLQLISRTYHEIMDRNRKMIMISIKEGDNLPLIREKLQKPPEVLFGQLTNYFQEMFQKDKIISSDSENLAFTFMAMNYGAFLNHLSSNTIFGGVTLETFISESINTFTRALTP